jgi:hypothetical protein
MVYKNVSLIYVNSGSVSCLLGSEGSEETDCGRLLKEIQCKSLGGGGVQSNN